jgi:hypothetical protein
MTSILAQHTPCLSSFCVSSLALSKSHCNCDRLSSNVWVEYKLWNLPRLISEAIFSRSGCLLCCAFREPQNRKSVRFVSTYMNAVHNQNEKPSIATTYNKFMGKLTCTIWCLEFTTITANQNQCRNASPLISSTACFSMHTFCTDAILTTINFFHERILSPL